MNCVRLSSLELSRRAGGRCGPLLVSTILGMSLLVVGCARRGSAPVASELGDVRVEVVLRTDPPRQDDNVVEILVEDRQGRPVDGAELTLVATMPAMAGMSEMRSTAAVEPLGEGRYRGSVDLPMRGTWGLDLAVASPAGGGAVSYSLTVGRAGLQVVGGGTTVPAVPAGLPDDVVASLRPAFESYEEARLLLSVDRVEGLAPPAHRLAASLGAADAAFATATGEVAHCLTEGTAAAERLAAATDLGAAREAFGEVSRYLLVLGAVDQRLAEGWHVFSCPMTPTFERWIQHPAELANPYMGVAMSSCGVPSVWSAPPSAASSVGEAPAATAGALAEFDVDHYSCSMHTSVRSDRPGTCPICSMDLVPVTREEVATGVITVDPQRWQTIGVRTAAVARRSVRTEVRAVGKVAFDETRLTDVSVKYAGWIGRLEADATGQPVRRGQTLFTLYSPELYAAQEEYLTALRSQAVARDTTAPERADYLVAAARERLKLWDLADVQIDALAAGGERAQYVPIVSPVSGYVIEKNVVAGAAVEPGMRLYRIAGLDRVWIEADVPESELPLIAVGQTAEVTLPNLGGARLAAEVAFLYPYLDAATRTGRIRLELGNPGLELKPHMYVDVVFANDRGERLMVPESAVLFAGSRRLVFLDLGGGRLRPQEVELGARSGDGFEVLSGLEEGSVVVTSGTFLIAAESRLKSATEQWQ
jgi:Cu(I)/Ag(I) efflux system membrane fusion protein